VAPNGSKTHLRGSPKDLRNTYSYDPGQSHGQVKESCIARPIVNRVFWRHQDGGETPSDTTTGRPRSV
jgi:hypothetical protein